MDKRSFGCWLKQRRKALDLTQDDLAHQIGYSVATIRKIEADKLRPSRQLVERFAQQLGVPEDDIEAFMKFARTGLLTDPHLWATDIEDTPATPEQTSHNRISNLPIWPTSLIGRDQEVAHMREYLLNPTIRLLTISGAPGIGKTRAAIHVAGSLFDLFSDGVYFVDLAPVRDPNMIPDTVARTIGVCTQADSSVHESLKQYLSNKHMLLLLDNFEHVVAGAAFIAELLTTAPDVKILVTSRARLHLYGEHEFSLQPLALPDLSLHLSSDELLAQYAAVALFCACAQATNPNFSLNETNMAAVAEICVRLDGLPLGIELAAARSRLFSPQALLARLTSRLEWLTDGPRNLPARQQTLRATIDWSYDLLSADEQLLFRHLGIFVGGCTIEAIRAVLEGTLASRVEYPDTCITCGPEARMWHSEALLSNLEALLGKSLLQHVEVGAGEARFALLETIREYALEQLKRHGELTQARQQHATFFLRYGEEGATKLSGPNQAIWLDRLEHDHDNLRAALKWFIETRQASAGLTLAGALREFWAMRGYLAEGRIWLEQALTLANEPSLLQAEVLFGIGSLSFRQGNYDVAETYYQKSLDLYRMYNNTAGIALALAGLAELQLMQNSIAEGHWLLCDEPRNPSPKGFDVRA